MEIVFATNNAHKLDEVRALLSGRFRVVGLGELGLGGDIPEEQETLEGNAQQKMRYIHDQTGMDCFADDTGLEVDALDGAPGVYSARYARMGEPVFPEMEPAEGNIRKLLLKLEGKENRRARFRTVIALTFKKREHLFEGIVRGEISHRPSGKRGFGYDPVFVPAGYDQTFAEMDLDRKNRISHRAIAAEKLAQFLLGV